MTVVDTTVWIDLFAGRETSEVVALEALVAGRADICVCGVILTEILQGIRSEVAYRRAASAFSGLLYLPMERETYLTAAGIYRALRLQGLTIRNPVDCMIAAVCVENDAALLHKDPDFEYIAGYTNLRIVDIESS